MKCYLKQLKHSSFTCVSILETHFANDKIIFPNGNDFCKTTFTHSLIFLCQSYLTFAHCLFCECQCDLSFARCRKCEEILECVLDYSTCQQNLLNALLHLYSGLISVADKWIHQSKQWILKFYTDSQYGKLALPILACSITILLQSD